MTTPLATYRLQFRDGMTFDRAITLVPYWQSLGISHLYASPIFSATEGSTHGYDVTDANAFDPALGGRDGFDRLARALKEAGIGLILDIVPNHMAASLENAWWRSIVTWGEQSPHARFFDVDWSRPLTLAVLGQDFDSALEAGEITLTLDPEGGLALAYYENRFPLTPASYEDVLDGAPGALAAKLTAFAASATPEDEAQTRETAKALVDEDAAGRDALEAFLKTLDADRIRAVHEAQPYRLVHWKVAASGLSYRRFFEVAGLAGLRVEDEAVFDAAHKLVLELVRDGTIDGLRIDHVDGLADPAAYLQRLRAAIGPDVYLVVEKIIEGEETIPDDWPIEGTTGYEFIAALTHLYVDHGQMAALDAAYRRFTGSETSYEAILTDAKQLMLDRNFEGEVKRLVSLGRQALPEIEEKPFTDALKALINAFPVYRTYGAKGALAAADREVLDRSASHAKARLDGAGQAALSALVGLLSGAVEGPAFEFRSRFQQLSGPVMAKAMEDTAFYRYNRFLALNEVGGHPDEPELSIAEFHHLMARRAEEQPLGLSTTSTHDTKRGEDARARLYAVSAVPEIWSDAVGRWHGINARHVKTLADGPAPEPALEWALYQALAGCWPEELSISDADGLRGLSERFAAYVEKTMREAKQRSDWSEVNEDYEGAVKDFAAALLSPDNTEFLRDFETTLKPIRLAGLYNGLSQTLVKMAAPGIPDVYQGSERADFSLVDPDNRRMPDYDTIASFLKQSNSVSLDPASLSSGEAKVALTARLIAGRAAARALFEEGDYQPLQISGEGSERLVAFGRVGGDAAAIAVAPCQLATLMVDGKDPANALNSVTIHIPDAIRGREYRDAVSGETVRLASELRLADLPLSPFALLIPA
ncbi:malto-oligosyltrehalose synthase [Rhizobium sp. YIM 134829]|uniref:malto-oligosyltrehalose synthase n=1 Tax=Rhizobium sp. YIM 134829 TaxID=3390453 RepID=UPI00397B1D6F